MKAKYCAFLRGINVNGINIKMDALKTAFNEMGFGEVKTILATGNVILSCEDIPDDKILSARIEKGLSQYFHYDAHVFVRNFEEIHNICTLGRTLDVPEKCHIYHLLCENVTLLTELQLVFESIPHKADEQFHVQDSCAFWVVPKGDTLHSEFGSKILGNKKYKACLTSRNINTMQKIHRAMC